MMNHCARCHNPEFFNREEVQHMEEIGWWKHATHKRKRANWDYAKACGAFRRQQRWESAFASCGFATLGIAFVVLVYCLTACVWDYSHQKPTVVYNTTTEYLPAPVTSWAWQH